jgi:hypothetical protein
MKTLFSEWIAASFKQLSVVSALLALVLLFGQAALSTPVMADGTPDGTTPANEGVCDVVKGKTPGLYGLCVAYCEAQDLDVVGDRETPNNKILANYRKKMQTGDPDMPCVRVPCPCWTDAQLANVNNSDLTKMLCTQTATAATVRNLSPVQFAAVDTSVPNCRFTDTTTTPVISVRFSGIDPTAAQSCYSQIVQKCQALGLLP